MTASMSVATMKAMRPLVAEAVKETIRDIDVHSRGAALEERERLNFISRSMQTSLNSAETALESHVALKNITDKYSHDATLCQQLRAIQRAQTQIVSNNVQHLRDSAALYESEYSPGSARLLDSTTRGLNTSMGKYRSSLTMGSVGISDRYGSIFSDDIDEEPSKCVESEETFADVLDTGDSAEETAAEALSAKDALNKQDQPRPVSDHKSRAAEAYTARFSDKIVVTDEITDEMTPAVVATMVEGEQVSDSEPQRSAMSAAGVYGDDSLQDYAWRNRILQNALYVAQFATAILILIRNSSSMTAGIGASVSGTETTTTSTPKGSDSHSGSTKGGPSRRASGLHSP